MRHANGLEVNCGLALPRPFIAPNGRQRFTGEQGEAFRSFHRRRTHERCHYRMTDNTARQLGQGPLGQGPLEQGQPESVAAGAVTGEWCRCDNQGLAKTARPENPSAR